MRLTAGSATDVGQLRTLNEDSLLVTSDLFAVADGMGGHRGGEVASARALEAFQEAAAQRSLDALMTAVQAANTNVLDTARATPELMGMGTTLCALAPLDDHRVAVVNVGDSRVYVLRGGALSQISEDHSFVETLVREGRLTRAQADVHPQRNVITRALGIEPHIDVDGWEVEVDDGDRFLLCSDGLFNEVTDQAIEALLVEITDPVEVAGRLIDAANAGGGRDNVTCVVVDVSGVTRTDAAPPVGRPIADSLTRRSTAADLDETTVDQPTVAPVPASTASTAAPVSASPQPETPAGRRRRSPTWRTVVFLLAIVTIFVVAIVATGWYFDNTYSVGSDDGNVAIYRGPADTSFLWFEAKVVEREDDLAVSDLTDANRARVEEAETFDSLRAARARVQEMARDAAQATTTTTTTTTVPETTVPDTSVTGTTVVPDSVLETIPAPA